MSDLFSTTTMDVEDYIDKRLVLQSITRRKILDRLVRPRKDEKPIPDEIKLLMFSHHRGLTAPILPRRLDDITHHISAILEGHPSLQLRQLVRDAYFRYTTFSAYYDLLSPATRQYTIPALLCKDEEVLQKVEKVDFYCYITTARQFHNGIVQQKSRRALLTKKEVEQEANRIAEAVPRMQSLCFSAEHDRQRYLEEPIDIIKRWAKEKGDLGLAGLVKMARMIVDKHAVCKKATMRLSTRTRGNLEAYSCVELLEGTIQDAYKRIKTGIRDAVHTSGRLEYEEKQATACISDSID